MRRELVLAPWSSRFHGPGMEEGPAAVAAVLGADTWWGVDFDLDAPPEQALAAGLPKLADDGARRGRARSRSSASARWRRRSPPACVAGTPTSRSCGSTPMAT